MNERITENIVRDFLRTKGFYDQEYLNIEEQKSQHPIVQKCLLTASKSGKGIGKPEFIIISNTVRDFVIVIECKADDNKHISEELNRYKDFAVDGVLLYAAHLSKEFNVIAIAISGEDKVRLKISTFLWVKGSNNYKILEDQYGKPVEEIISFNDYIRYATIDHDVERIRYENLISFSRELHDYIRDYAKLSEAEKPLVVSGILIALSDNAFSKNYKYYDIKILPRELSEAIKREIDKAEIPNAKKQNITQPYSFITAHPELCKLNKITGVSPLWQIISDIEEHVVPFINVYHNFDVIGQFYGEFLRYAGGDASLGIVLTPKHITELFAKLANLTPQSKVLDICAGTGGFLIASMIDMIKKATNDDERKLIKKEKLIGVENQPKMYALAASNMILRGDGKANLFQGSCFDEPTVKEIKSRKPTVGMINPPYSQKGAGLHELNFVLQMLECLVENGIGIAIVPMSCAIQSHPLREVILKKHTLEAVMSMPDDLFYPVGSIPCIMVLKAHVPHNSNPHHKTWFGFWKDDGYIKTKHQGRIDLYDKWTEIQDKWCSSYFNREEIPGLSVKKKVTAEDEWCAEAYMETNYSKLTEEDFMQDVKKYILFKIKEN
ncbi:MAG TPA: SAM-dependent methyltransferase [Firmicutes bacterium]|jgi:type I restriction enzyme M protein|nr:SAM-dependent methyltransferase [Bacillota bacterium]